MYTLTELLQADPFDAGLVQAKLQSLGFVEPAPAPPKTAVRTWGKPAVTTAPPPTARAEKLIDGLAKTASEREALFAVLDALVEELARSADPMRALLNFARLADGAGDRTAFFGQLRQRPALLARLARLLGFSQALADTLVLEPELVSFLGQPAHAVARGTLRRQAREESATGATPDAQVEALRRFRRRETLRIGLLDMERQTWRNARDFALVVRQISDLAIVCVQEALRIVGTEQGLSDQSGSVPGFAVIAMGKLGGRELNYSSDIDLVFLHDGERDTMLRLGQRLLKVLSDRGAQGTLFRVDMRLRPEGRNGPLVTSLPYALSYYESYAAAWEWQALIKARAIAGDVELGRRFRRFTRSVAFARRADDAHLAEIVDMKRRSEETAEGADEANVKQGPGAIRDAEWIVQQLQMMIGPAHPRARASDTLGALKALLQFRALTHDEARTLGEGYVFLRVLEHRLQLLDERAVRTLPSDEGEMAALARRMGCKWRNGAATRWLHEEHTRHRRAVRALCERLFWGWREWKDEGSRMKDEKSDAEPRPAGLNGGTHAPNALEPSSFSLHPYDSLHPSADVRRRLERIAEGTTTHPFPAPLARQVRAALPDALRDLDHAANPERAVTNLERLCEASGNRLSLLRSLGAEPRLGRAVLTILGGSEFIADTLIRSPELLDMAAYRPLLAEPKSWEQARADCRSYCLTFRDRGAALRRWKRREMLRIGLRDLVMDAPPHEITSEIARLAQACLSFACDETGAMLRPDSDRMTFAVLGLGKLGGSEMHYASDCDVLFCHETPAPFEGAPYAATRWAGELTRLMGERTEEGVCFALDARLRPHGRSGPIAPSLRGYIDYFESPSGLAVWERQALTRARFAAGDAETAARLMAAIRHVAFPEEWRPAWSDELRHIKARVENERAAPGSQAVGSDVFDVKLGRGALSDIEFCAQWLAMKHGARLPALQTPGTLRQISAARDGGVLPDADATALSSAYDFLRRAELRLQIAGEHSAKAVRRGSAGWVTWARAVYPDMPSEAASTRFDEAWRHHATAVRAVMERVRDEL